MIQMVFVGGSFYLMTLFYIIFLIVVKKISFPIKSQKNIHYELGLPVVIPLIMLIAEDYHRSPVEKCQPVDGPYFKEDWTARLISSVVGLIIQWGLVTSQENTG